MSDLDDYLVDSEEDVILSSSAMLEVEGGESEEDGGSSSNVNAVSPEPLDKFIQNLPVIDETGPNETLSGVSSHLLGTIQNVQYTMASGQPNAFAKLVRGWEAYMND
jgi:hypothetical protein